MFVMGYLLKALSSLLHVVLQLAILLFIVRAVMSWFQPDPRQPLVAFIYQITDPVIERVRRLVPTAGAVDFSPLIIILALLFLDWFLVPTLAQLGGRLI